MYPVSGGKGFDVRAYVSSFVGDQITGRAELDPIDQ